MFNKDAPGDEACLMFSKGDFLALFHIKIYNFPKDECLNKDFPQNVIMFTFFLKSNVLFEMPRPWRNLWSVVTARWCRYKKHIFNFNMIITFNYHHHHCNYLHHLITKLVFYVNAQVRKSDGSCTASATNPTSGECSSLICPDVSIVFFFLLMLG